MFCLLVSFFLGRLQGVLFSLLWDSKHHGSFEVFTGTIGLFSQGVFVFWRVFARFCLPVFSEKGLYYRLCKAWVVLQMESLFSPGLMVGLQQKPIFMYL